MIATRRIDSATDCKEDLYTIRRILVRRLQSTSKGVSRKARVERHRAFAREWESYRRNGAFDLLRRAVSIGPAVAAEAGEGWRNSFLLELAASARPLRLQRSIEPETHGDLGVCAVDFQARAVSADPQSNLFNQQYPLDQAV